MTAFPIPIEALDSDIAVLGRKGGGKTYTAKGIVEHLLTMGRRVLVLDPLGVWAGLRTAADGESPGFPIAIFGGRHADLPLDTAAAASIADVLARENVPAVIDLSELSKMAQQSFLLGFLHEIRRVNTEAITIVLEEADVFAPQNPLGDDSKQLHSEIDWIARRGRFKGFRLITVCQRPARLSKDVLTQAATLIVHRLPAPQDRDAVKAWVDGNGDREQAREVDATLATLAVGEAWIWASELGILRRAKFPPITTLDTSSTPKAGEARIEPKTLADVDLSGIKAALAAASLPKAKAKSGGSVDAAAIEAARREGHRAGYEEGHQAGRKEGIAVVREAFATALFAAEAPIELSAAERDALRDRWSKAAAAPATAAPVKILAPRPREAFAGVPSSAAKMLAVLDTNPPVLRSWQQVATLAGLKARGGHFNAGRKWLMDSHTVSTSGDLVAIANPSASAPAPTSDPAAMVELWASNLSGAAPRILRRLFELGGAASKETIAHALRLLPRGGHWNAAWKELRDNGVVHEDGEHVTLSALFHPKKRKAA